MQVLNVVDDLGEAGHDGIAAAKGVLAEERVEYHRVVLRLVLVVTLHHGKFVKIGEKYMVIGIGKDNITSICELSAEDIKPVTESPSQSIETFKILLDKARQRIGKGDNGNEK